jgi:3-oxoacyl-[acyl-carrier-protein] synthase-3
MTIDGSAWRTAAAMAVRGTGWAVPGEALSSDELIDRVGQRFGFTRTGTARLLAERMRIRSRHISRAFTERAECALPGLSNPCIAAEAVRRALKSAGIGVHQVGYLIAHTTTPETQLPPNASYVADLLGYDGPYVELRQACTGFANALMIASGLLASGACSAVVIVGSETGSLFLDPGRLDDAPDQIVNLVQMGDGAGAIVLGPETQPIEGRITAAWFGTAGRDREPGIRLDNGALHFTHSFARIAESGPALFEAGLVAVAAAGLRLDDIDLVIPHQVSGRIGEQFSQQLGIAEERMFVNADRLGNTGSAAMWIALAELREGDLKPGMRMAALGAEASKYMYGGFIYEHG